MSNRNLQFMPTFVKLTSEVATMGEGIKAANDRKNKVVMRAYHTLISGIVAEGLTKSYQATLIKVVQNECGLTENQAKRWVENSMRALFGGKGAKAIKGLTECRTPEMVAAKFAEEDLKITTQARLMKLITAPKAVKEKTPAEQVLTLLEELAGDSLKVKGEIINEVIAALEEAAGVQRQEGQEGAQEEDREEGQEEAAQAA